MNNKHMWEAIIWVTLIICITYYATHGGCK